MSNNTPNFLLDRKASALIAEAGRWISSKMNGNTDAVLDKLEKENPERFDKLLVNPVFEQDWHKYHNLDRLKSELRGWMKEWGEVINAN